MLLLVSLLVVKRSVPSVGVPFLPFFSLVSSFSGLSWFSGLSGLSGLPVFVFVVSAVLFSSFSPFTSLGVVPLLILSWLITSFLVLFRGRRGRSINFLLLFSRSLNLGFLNCRSFLDFTFLYVLLVVFLNDCYLFLLSGLILDSDFLFGGGLLGDEWKGALLFIRSFFLLLLAENFIFVLFDEFFSG